MTRIPSGQGQGLSKTHKVYLVGVFRFHKDPLGTRIAKNAQGIPYYIRQHLFLGAPYISYNMVVSCLRTMGVSLGVYRAKQISVFLGSPRSGAGGDSVAKLFAEK